VVARRTYFGVGFPKAPASSEPAVTGDSDGDDRSPPPVDDDRTAERLNELRSWYQGDATGGSPPIDKPPPEHQQPQPVPAAARSTPVGHSSGGVPTRPHAPDPMRATMFGHQIHSLDFDQPSAPDLPPATNPPSQEDAGVAGEAGRAPNRRPAASPPPPAWETPSQPDPSRLADYLRRQAAQPHPPVATTWMPSVDDPHPHARWKTPIIVVVVGVAALAASVILALRTGDTPGGGMAPVPPVALPVVPSTSIDRAPASRSAPAASADLAAGPRQAVLQQVKRNVDDLAARLPPNTKPRPRPVKAQQPPVEEGSTLSASGDQANELSPPAESSSDKKPQDKAPAGGPEPTQPPPAGN
jgi:hypothetical protein